MKVFKIFGLYGYIVIIWLLWTDCTNYNCQIHIICYIKQLKSAVVSFYHLFIFYHQITLPVFADSMLLDRCRK